MGIAIIITGIVGLVLSVAGTFLFGNVGAIIAGVLGAAAIVAGVVRIIKQGKRGGAVFGIVSGVLAIILALSISSGMSAVLKDLHTKALEMKPDGLWAQVSEKTDDGFVGLLSRMPTDETSLNALMDEIKELNPDPSPAEAK